MPKSMDHSDETQTMSSTSLHMTIGGQIRLKNVPPAMEKAIKKKLRLPNPTYQQAIRANPRAKFTLSPHINYYETCKTTGDLLLPRGCAGSVRRYARSCGYGFEDRDERVSRPLETKLRSTIKLRPYQSDVPELATAHPQGLVRLDTGFGKTIIGIKIIEFLQQRTLIIVPKLDLLNQWKYEIQKWTGVTNVGQVGGGKHDWQDITVATCQSLESRRVRSEDKSEDYGLVLVDECHGFTTPKRRSLLGGLPAHHRYGLTATDRRSDGQGEALKWIFGDKLVDKTIPRATPKVQIVPFTGHIWVQDYHAMIEEQVNDIERNALIVDQILSQVDSGRKVLVLTKRVKHYEELARQIDRDGVIQFHSGQKSKDRSDLLNGLRMGDIKYSCLLGTFSLLSTGIDIPSLDTLLLAGDLRSDVLVEQSAGRILRLFEGKEDPLIIDIQDKGNGILRRQGMLRQSFYRERGWEITGV